MSKIINIAVIGLGQVGNYLLNELNSKKKDIELKTGKQIKVVAVCARSINKKRKYKVNKNIFFKNPLEIFKKEKVDIFCRNSNNINFNTSLKLNFFFFCIKFVK